MSDEQPVGCLWSIFRTLAGRDNNRRVAERGLPVVRVNKFFVTDAEANFFRVLVRVVGDRGHVLSQVSLKQLIYFPGTFRTNAGKATWSNKVDQRSVDFVVCDAATLKPRLVIELDEPSHARADRQTRDDEVEAIISAAGLPMIHVLTSRNYDTRELASAISPHLAAR